MQPSQIGRQNITIITWKAEGILDQEGEWWYDTYNNADSLYYYAANGVNPNRLDFRGKVQSYAFSITGSQYVQIKNLEFFATTVYFSNGDNCLVYGCNFMYPSCSKRMLRTVDTEPEMTKFALEVQELYTELRIPKYGWHRTGDVGGTDTVDNCYFNKIDYSVADNSSIMLTIRMNGTSNVFRKNTVHRTGGSATVMVGDAGLVEYNNLYDTGTLQSDGSMIQFMEGNKMVLFVDTTGYMIRKSMAPDLTIAELQMELMESCIIIWPGTVKVVG